MTLYWKVLSMPFTDSREPGAPLYSCSVHEAPGLYAGAQGKRAEVLSLALYGHSSVYLQFLFGKLAVLDVGGSHHHISQLQAEALSITFETV